MATELLHLDHAIGGGATAVAPDLPPREYRAPRMVATAKLEYLQADFGSSQLFDIVPGIPETVDLRIDVRVGLNYRFDAAALHLH